MLSDFEEIVEQLSSLSNPEAASGMARFGITGKKVLGVSIPSLRKMAKKIGRNHDLAQKLWESGVHEARILASMIDVPEMVTKKQMESWARDFDSWDLCDQCCNNLFCWTGVAYGKAFEWSTTKDEFLKRAGFVLIAALAVHDKNAGDGQFLKFLPTIERQSVDDRNFVKKAVNWSLRQIGKRDINLNQAAIRTARRIREIGSTPAKWIATDALRELTCQAIKARLMSSPRHR